MYYRCSKVPKMDCVGLPEAIRLCNTASFITHWRTWLQQLLQACKQAGESVGDAVNLRLLADVLILGAKVSAVKREIALDHASGVLSVLLGVLRSECSPVVESALECLSACLMHYPGSCAQLRKQIDAIFTKQFDSLLIYDSFPLCIARLTFVGAQGKLAAQWLRTVCDLSKLVYRNLSLLYEGCTHLEWTGPTETGLSEPSFIAAVPTLTALDVDRLTLQIVGVFRTLGFLFSDAYPVEVQAPYAHLVRLVCCACLKPSACVKYRSDVLPRLSHVHTAAVEFLCQLIAVVGMPACVLSGTIADNIVLAELGAADAAMVAAGEDYVYVERWAGVKQATYKALSTLVTVLGAASQFATFSERLLDVLRKDLSPLEVKSYTSHLITNSVLASKSKRKKARASVNAYAALVPDDADAANVDVVPLAWKAELIVAACDALCALLFTVGAQVKVGFYRDMQACVTTLLLRLQRTPSIAPYNTHVKCRVALYRTLLSFVTTLHPHWPSAMQCAVPIFTFGTQDLHVEVRRCCREALAVCGALCRPRVPPMESCIVVEKEATAQEGVADRTVADVSGGTALPNDIDAHVQGVRPQHAEVGLMQTRESAGVLFSQAAGVRLSLPVVDLGESASSSSEEEADAGSDSDVIELDETSSSKRIKLHDGVPTGRQDILPNTVDVNRGAKGRIAHSECDIIEKEAGSRSEEFDMNNMLADFVGVND